MQEGDRLAMAGRAVDGLVSDAQECFGPDLISITLYGTAAENRLRETADVNVILVFSNLDSAALERFAPKLAFARGSAPIVAIDELRKCGLTRSHPCHCRPRQIALIRQFELPVPQFVGRLAVMRRVINSAADQNLFVDTRATGHLLCAPQGMNHFLAAAKAAAAEVIILDPLYSTHDRDENDT
jgi:hypothetical protein